MFVLLTSFPGFDGEVALLITVVIAALWLTLAMIAVVFFAWAPHVSEGWQTQFGTGLKTADSDETQSE